jgi:hypothetical protein
MALFTDSGLKRTGLLPFSSYSAAIISSTLASSARPLRASKRVAPANSGDFRYPALRLIPIQDYLIIIETPRFYAAPLPACAIGRQAFISWTYCRQLVEVNPGSKTTRPLLLNPPTIIQDYALPAVYKTFNFPGIS